MSSVLIGLAMVGVAAVILWLARAEKDPKYAERGFFSVKQEEQDKAE